MARIAGRSASETRSHILGATIELLDERDSHEIRVTDIARRASVGVPTIYYHFSSREVLLAEAQVANFFRLLRGRSGHVAAIGDAVARGDHAAFVAAYHDYHTEISSPASTERMWQLARTLIDIHVDPLARERYIEEHDESLRRRRAIFVRAQELGWIDPAIDPTAYIQVSGALILGRILLDGSRLDVDPETIASTLWSWIAPCREPTPDEP